MPQRHFSMLRDFQLADSFTLANAFCGTGAVFAAMRYLQDGMVRDLMLGMALIPLAFVFDALDGRIARWRKVASTLGRELDSLADVISFGLAPAALGYACGLQGGWDAAAILEVPEMRVDGVLKTTGRARYTRDVDLPGMLWAKFLMSPHPHARIVVVAARHHRGRRRAAPRGSAGATARCPAPSG